MSITLQLTCPVCGEPLTLAERADMNDDGLITTTLRCKGCGAEQSLHVFLRPVEKSKKDKGKGKKAA